MTENLGFDEPDDTGNGVRLYPKDIVGHLLLVWAIEYIPYSPSQFTQPGKPSDVVTVDVVDLDQRDPETQAVGLLARRTWWRQAQLIKALKPKVGGMSPLLVRMGKGVAGMGRTAPFVLQSMTQDPNAVRMANGWLQTNPTFVPSLPLPPVPVAPDDGADPWAGQPAAELPPARPPAAGQVPTQMPARQETALERMARLSQNQQDAWGQRGGIPSKPEDIPF